MHKVKKYLEDNKTPKRTYTRNWCSVWFILFAIVEVIRAINTINPLVK